MMQARALNLCAGRRFQSSVPDKKLARWLEGVHRVETNETDTVDANRAKGLLATLPAWSIPKGYSAEEGSVLPLFHHLALFQPLVHSSALKDDGTEVSSLSPVMPDTDLPHERKWASGSVELVHSNPLCVGQQVSQRTTIESAVQKEGRSGRLLLVTQRKDISNANGVSCIERRCHVYAPPNKSVQPAPQPVPPSERRRPDFSEVLLPTPALLFRFSALTFNSHRIHYDHEYCLEVAKVRGRLVHAPMNALLLAALAVREQPALKRFSYRATAPLVVNEELDYCGTQDGQLWASAKGNVGMTASWEV